MLGCLEEGSRWAWKGGLGMNVIQKLKALWEGVRLRKRGRGRPRTRPRVVYGDGAYDAEAIRAALRGGGIRAGIRENRGGERRPGRGGLVASMKKRIPRSGGAWRGSWRGGREGLGGFP